MKLVVTGALGHIGSRLIRDLPALFPRLELELIDDLSTQRFASLFHLPSGACYRFHEADVRDAPLDPLFNGADAVVHLAAITEAEASVRDPERVALHNLSATRSVAEACARTGVPLIFPSSTSVYGPQSATVAEDCPAADLRPQSQYAETKLREEELLHDLGQSAGLRYATLRLGTIFGPSPGMRFHTAVNKFCWQAATGQPLSVWRSALDQYRPYLDLGDAVRAVAFVIRQRLFDRATYNVVTLNATVGEIIGVIRRCIPDLQIELVDHPLMNQLSYSVSNDRLRQAGFEFQGDLSAAIRGTMQMLMPEAGSL